MHDHAIPKAGDESPCPPLQKMPNCTVIIARVSCKNQQSCWLSAPKGNTTSHAPRQRGRFTYAKLLHDSIVKRLQNGPLLTLFSHKHALHKASCVSFHLWAGAHRNPLNGLFNICIFENDHWALATQLHCSRTQVPGSCQVDSAAGGHTASECHLGHIWMRTVTCTHMNDTLADVLLPSRNSRQQCPPDHPQSTMDHTALPWEGRGSPTYPLAHGKAKSHWGFECAGSGGYESWDHTDCRGQVGRQEQGGVALQQ